MAKLIRSPLEERLKAWHGEEWHTTKGRIIRDIVYAIDTRLVITVLIGAISCGAGFLLGRIAAGYFH